MILTKSIKLPKVNHEWYDNPLGWWGLAMSEFYDLEEIFKRGVGKMTLNLDMALLILCVGEAYDLPKNYGPFQSSAVRKRLAAAISLAMPEWGTVDNIADCIKMSEKGVKNCIDEYSEEHEVRMAVTRYKTIRALISDDFDGIWDNPKKYLETLYDEFGRDYERAKNVFLQ
jgi:hypothetical protein